MQRYKNLSGDSGVIAYEILDEGIEVRFRDGRTYLYTNGSAGRENIETMKQLARAGRGLSTFISTTVRHRYVRRY
jgi:hypothetical protein